MPTMNMPPKKREADDSDPLLASQRRPKEERYRLQVDRQTKASFSTIDSAEKAGAEIKKLYPVVKVTIYDVHSNATKVIEQQRGDIRKFSVRPSPRSLADPEPPRVDLSPSICAWDVCEDSEENRFHTETLLALADAGNSCLSSRHQFSGERPARSDPHRLKNTRCGLAALQASLIAIDFLQEEIEGLKKDVSTGFTRGRVRKAAPKTHTAGDFLKTVEDGTADWARASSFGGCSSALRSRQKEVGRCVSS